MGEGKIITLPRLGLILEVKLVSLSKNPQDNRVP